jgi:hypothetical protein
MFALSITFKILIWYCALMNGDTGRPSRPWVLGTVVAFVFAGFDVCTDSRTHRSNLILSVVYLVAAVALMNIYYRTHSVALSLLVGGIGTAVLLFGVPYFTDVVFR